MAVYPFHRIILPFRLHDPPYSTGGHLNPKPLFNLIMDLHPNRFDRIEICAVGRPDKLLYSLLLPAYSVIIVNIRGGIIIHYHNPRPLYCSSSKSKRIQKRKLNAFTIVNQSFPPFLSMPLSFSSRGAWVSVIPSGVRLNLSTTAFSRFHPGRSWPSAAAFWLFVSYRVG